MVAPTLPDEQADAIRRPPGAPAYQYSLSPTCIWRGSFTWLVTLPKVPESRLVLPVPNVVRLRTLKASPRRSARNHSRMWNDLAMEIFSLRPQKARTLGL